jgi:hypothetical protein
MAASFRAFGISEWSLRLPGMVAGVLLVPAVYLLAAAIYDRRTALLAALLVAASPFAILFAPTAFTDPWLTLWMVVALWAAFSRRPFAAGLATGLAVASKQQGVLVVPLVLVALFISASKSHPAQGRGGVSPPGCVSRDRAGKPCPYVLTFLAALLGFALIFAPLTYWDSLRWHNRPSFWDRSLTTYAPLTLAPLSSWGERAADWAQQFGYLFGHPVVTAGIVVLATYVALNAIRDVARSETGHSHSMPFDLLIGAFIATYLVLHVVITFQPWDRYLLPLVPLLCILAAASIHGRVGVSPPSIPASAQLPRAGRPCPYIAQLMIMFVATVSLSFAAWLGMAGRLPVGSDHGAYAGLEQGIALLTDRPADAIIYHHSLGWYYDFYLFDAPQDRRWYGTAWKLADDAIATPDREQWLLLPEWEMGWLDDFRLALAARGLMLAESASIYRPDGSRSFVLYRIAPLRGSMIAATSSRRDTR